MGFSASAVTTARRLEDAADSAESTSIAIAGVGVCWGRGRFLGWRSSRVGNLKLSLLKSGVIRIMGRYPRIPSLVLLGNVLSSCTLYFSWFVRDLSSPPLSQRFPARTTSTKALHAIFTSPRSPRHRCDVGSRLSSNFSLSNLYSLLRPIRQNSTQSTSNQRPTYLSPDPSNPPGAAQMSVVRCLLAIESIQPPSRLTPSSQSPAL